MRTIVVSALVLILFALTLFHKFGGGIRIPSILLRPNRDSAKSVRCVVVAKVSGKTVRLAFNIPSEDKTHWDEIRDKLPKIKHEVVMLFEHQELIKTLENKDFDNLKKRLLQVVNAQSSRPIEAVFLDNFFYD